MNRRMTTRNLCFLMVPLLAACGQSSSVGGAPSASGADTQSAQQSTQSANDASSSDGAAANHSATSGFAMALDLDKTFALPTFGNFNDTVMTDGCSGSVLGQTSMTGGILTLDANITFSPSACNGHRQLSGTQSVVATWSTSGRTLQVTTNLTRTFGNHDSVTVTTLDPNKGATYQISATGTPGSGSVAHQIALNEHRVRKASDGNVLFDHNITTDANASVDVTTAYDTSGAKPVPKTRTLTSGAIKVQHNLAHFLATHTFQDVVHDLTGTCTCPQAGTIIQTVAKDDNSGSYTRTYAFSGCGQATVTTSASTLSGTSNGTATITWNDCTN